MKNSEIMIDSLERPTITKSVKIVMVGPAKCGKTSLVQRFVNNIFCDTYIPTGFEKYSTKNKIDEYLIEYSIWDTSGSNAYDTVRPLAYQDANIFLLCFNIGDAGTLESAVKKFFPEIRMHCNQAPIILCGCRSDSRVNYDKLSYTSSIGKTQPATQDQILSVCKEINAAMFVETSSLYSNLAVQEAFEYAAKIALSLFNTSSSKTNINNSSTTINNNNKKNKKLNTLNNNITIKSNNNKSNIRNELKGKAKNCSIM